MSLAASNKDDGCELTIIVPNSMSIIRSTRCQNLQVRAVGADGADVEVGVIHASSEDDPLFGANGRVEGSG